MRLAISLFAAFAAGGTAWADCDHFKWSLAQEKQWFAAAPEPVDAGAEVAAAPHAYELTLKAGEAAGFALPPKTPAPAGEYAGAVKLAALTKPGVYQVTVSREAWVDAVQNDKRVRSRNVSRQRDCPTFAKSVRFELEAGPAVLQFSRVAEGSLVFSVAAP